LRLLEPGLTITGFIAMAVPLVRTKEAIPAPETSTPSPFYEEAKRAKEGERESSF